MTKLKLAAALLIAAGTVGTAHADNAMQVCGARYQAAKTAGTLPASQTWNQFLAQCRAGLPKTVANPAKPAAVRAASAKPVGGAGQPSAAQSAMYAREHKCGAQWQADKAAGKVPAGQKWPEYWSACNKRLK